MIASLFDDFATPETSRFQNIFVVKYGPVLLANGGASLSPPVPGAASGFCEDVELPPEHAHSAIAIVIALIADERLTIVGAQTSARVALTWQHHDADRSA